ncbi:MAG: TIGR03905 family TSCPD domain-containing protein [Christensenellaceae bacterium]|jgi:uncharacterized protein (TIGR03905 family)|nr:TIGR03905 family TSCPD domain-containing protein [Christensenellaceae bacterium]
MAIYKLSGTCASAVDLEIEGGLITKLQFTGGCMGNTQGVAKLAIGRRPEEVIGLVEGIQCRNGTSCPDQLAKALKKALASA